MNLNSDFRKLLYVRVQRKGEYIQSCLEFISASKFFLKILADRSVSSRTVMVDDGDRTRGEHCKIFDKTPKVIRPLIHTATIIFVLCHAVLASS